MSAVIFQRSTSPNGKGGSEGAVEGETELPHQPGSLLRPEKEYLRYPGEQQQQVLDIEDRSGQLSSRVF
jgi:hypothetical protein